MNTNTTLLKKIRQCVFALASGLFACGVQVAAANFNTDCASEPHPKFGYSSAVTLYGTYEVPAQPAKADQPALPVALTVMRAQCWLNRQFAFVVVKMTPQGADARYPKVTVVQTGRDLGWFGADYSGGTVRFGQGFQWEPARAGQDGKLAEAIWFAVKPGDGVSFDPLEPFQLRVEYTYSWPPGTPAAVLDIPGAPFDRLFYGGNAFYWDPTESGSGLLVQRNAAGTVFALWFTFDENGNPTWFYMPNGQPVARGTVEGDVYFPEGPPLGVEPFDSSQFRPGNPVGRFRLEFPGVPAGPAPTVAPPAGTPVPLVTFSYDVRGHKGTKQVRYLDAGGVPGWSNAEASMLWNPTESGWGLVTVGSLLLYGYSNIHAVLATYGGDGKPTWLFSPMTPREVTERNFSFDIRRYAGPTYEVHGSYYGGPYAPEKLRLDPQRTSFSLQKQGYPGTSGFAFNYSPGRSVLLQPFVF